MPKYILKEGPRHYEWVDGEFTLLKAGVEVSMSEDRYRKVKDRFTPVEVYEAVQSTTPAEPPKTNKKKEPAATEESLVSYFVGLGAADAKSSVIDIDDLSLLAEILSVETRSSVLSAVEKRIEQLSE